MVFGVALLSVSALVLVPMGLAFCFCQLDNPEREESLTVRQEEHLSITIDEEEKMSIFDLISSIGGVLGLFVGASFVSFVESVPGYKIRDFAFIVEKTK